MSVYWHPLFYKTLAGTKSTYLATLGNIKSKVWSISVLGPGIIAEGLASLRQCIMIILHTSLGSDPLRPLFGSRVYKYQDAPTTIAIPNIKASIIEALSIWEKRIKVQSVNHRYNDIHHLEFEITYLLVDENLIDSIIFNPGDFSGGGTSNVVLQMIFPPNVHLFRNYVQFIYRGSPALPAPPFGGFANTTDTYNWCRINWANYGRWELLSDRILLYLRPGNYAGSSLAMNVFGTALGTKFIGLIPAITTPGTSYNILFDPNATGLLESNVIQPTIPLLTKEEVLQFAKNNWASYGVWAVEYLANIPGSFNTDFSTDFERIIDGYALVLYSTTVNTAQLEVEII